MNSKLFVNGDVSMNSKLFVNGDVSMNSKLFVNGDISFNNFVTVGGNVHSKGLYASENSYVKQINVGLNYDYFYGFDNNLVNSGLAGPLHNMSNNGISETYSSTDVQTGTSSISFNGTNQYLTFPNFSFKNTGFSVAFWGKFDVPSNMTRTVFLMKNSSNTKIIECYVFSGTNLYFELTGSSQVFTNVINGDNTWRHYVFTMSYSASNTGTMLCYVNGSLASTVSNTYYPPVLTNLTVNVATNGTSYLTGKLDQLIFQDNIISGADVLQIYNKSSGIYNSVVGIASTNIKTGELIVNGGVGIGGNVNVGGSIVNAGLTNSLVLKANLAAPSFTGIVVSAGDVSMNSRLFVNGDVSFTSNLFVGGSIVNTGLTNALTAKAPLASPTFTGTVRLTNKTFFGVDNIGGGTGDNAFVELIINSGESTTLKFVNDNEVNDHISFMPSGNLGIGTTTPDAGFKLDVSGNLRASGNIHAGSNAKLFTIGNDTVLQNINSAGWLYINGGTTGYGNTGVTVDTGGNVGIKGSPSTSFALNVTGNVQAGKFSASSDYRIKENVEPLDGTFTVDVLKPVSYKNTLTKAPDIGFIAHEVQEHYPYLVSGEKDGKDMQSLNYIGLIGILTKEIQDLKKRVSELENKK